MISLGARVGRAGGVSAFLDAGGVGGPGWVAACAFGATGAGTVRCASVVGEATVLQPDNANKTSPPIHNSARDISVSFVVARCRIWQSARLNVGGDGQRQC